MALIPLFAGLACAPQKAAEAGARAGYKLASPSLVVGRLITPRTGKDRTESMTNRLQVRSVPSETCRRSSSGVSGTQLSQHNILRPESSFHLMMTARVFALPCSDPAHDLTPMVMGSDGVVTSCWCFGGRPHRRRGRMRGPMRHGGRAR